MPDVWDIATARDEGVGRCRLSGESFRRVTAGAYLPAEVAGEVLERCRAVQHVRPDSVASHWSAVQLLGLPLPPTRRREQLHALVGPGSRPMRREGVIGHRSSQPVPVSTVDGVRTTAPVRTWCDLARSGADVRELVAVADALVRRWPRLRVELERAVAAGGRRRGIGTARRALALVDPRSESVMESWLRVTLHLVGVAPPVPQLVVLDERGVFVARVDLAWPDRRLVVEYDGDHHRDRAVWVRDLRRREELERLGWTVLVVTAGDLLRHPRTVALRVRARLATPPSGAPSPGGAPSR